MSIAHHLKKDEELIESYQKENFELKLRVYELEKGGESKEELVNEIERLKIINSNLLKQVNSVTLNNNGQSVNNKNAEIECKECKDLKSQIDSIKNANSKTITQLTQEFNKQQSTTTQRMTELNDKIDSITTQLNSTLDEKINQLSKYTQIIQSATVKHKQYKQQIQELTLTNYKQMSHDLASQLQHTQQQLQQLQHSYDQSTSSLYSQLSLSKHSTNSTLTCLNKQLSSQLSTLSNTLSTTRSQLVSTQHTLSTFTAENKHLRNKLSKREKVLNVLLNRLNATGISFMHTADCTANDISLASHE